MEKFINYNNLRSFAYVNDNVCKKPIKGVVLSFFGLGGATMYESDTLDGEYFGEKGLLYVIPYTNPWAWMNRQTVSLTDEIIDVLIEKYDLDESIPIVSSGGSMGGQSALVYTAYAKHTPIACVANCPVCDVVFHLTERDDLPRTLYSAVYSQADTLEDGLKSISPLHIIDKLPKIKYHIFHCSADKAVNIDAHSDKFVAKMKKRNHSITYDIANGRRHCDLTLALRRKYNDYIVESVINPEDF